MKQIAFFFLTILSAFSLGSCREKEQAVERNPGPQFSIQTNDTDFSKGRLGYRQEITFGDLVRFHGHPCDGLIEGALALQFGLYQLYPDSIVDRTNTRIVSRSSPCLADAALLLTGARYQYGHFFVSNDIPGLYVIGRTDKEEAYVISRKDGVKPPLIDQLGNLAIENKLSPCGLDSLRLLEEKYAGFLLNSGDLSVLFEVKVLENFRWDLPLQNDFIKTDIVNKYAPECITNQ